MFFGLLLIFLAVFLFFKKRRLNKSIFQPGNAPKGWMHHTITDKNGETYSYTYNQTKGIIISIIVGYLSPVLGIGGGIIHVPALVQLLHFPVMIATATSHFILAIMSLVSVIVHAVKGNYNDPLCSAHGNRLKHWCNRRRTTWRLSFTQNKKQRNCKSIGYLFGIGWPAYFIGCFCEIIFTDTSFCTFGIVSCVAQFEFLFHRQ